MDPITAFAMAQGALKAIRSGVEFYKECQAAAADVSEVTTEISGHIGKFLDAKTVVQDAAAKAKQDSEDPSNAGNINSQALNNVMMQMQLENAEKELREMLVYQTPGLGAVWSRFEDERNRLSAIQEAHKERERLHQEQLRHIAAKKAAARKRAIMQLWHDAHWVLIVISVILMFGGCMYLIVRDRAEQYPELGRCFIPKGSPGYEFYNNLRWVDCTIPV
jgi:hypothetical protein